MKVIYKKFYIKKLNTKESNNHSSFIKEDNQPVNINNNTFYRQVQETCRRPLQNHKKNYSLSKGYCNVHCKTHDLKTRDKEVI